MYILIDNYDSFTYNIYQYLSELTDEEIQVYRNDAVTVDEIASLKPEGIIISPGPGRPEDAGVSVDVVKRFSGKVPILGVCLGHQAIGYAFGGAIVQAGRIVHGKAESIVLDNKGLFRTIPNPSTFTRYHSLVLDPGTLPEELEVSARSSDGEIMGLRHKEFIVEGVQFHPESIASEYGKELLRNFLTYRREPLPHKELLAKILRKEDLEQKEAASFMRELTEGNLSHAQIAAYLIGLNSKGIAAREIAGCAQVLQEKRIPLSISKPVLDTCGTGGDGIGTFNISSFAALIVASCGGIVAKHGNRAVSSISGSADFYRELGIVIDLPPSKAKELIETTGFGFLFAPIYHGAMKYAAPVRKELGIKTIMNLLGPLVNPAGASYQLIGVFDGELCLTLAEAAKLLGIKRATIVHGEDGLDEISVSGPTRIVRVDENGEVREERLDPRDLGIGPHKLDSLKGGSAEENVAIARKLLDGVGPEAIRDAVALNAAAALQVSGSVASIEEGYKLAIDSITNGAVARKTQEVIDTSQRLQAEQAE